MGLRTACDSQVPPLEIPSLECYPGTGAGGSGARDCVAGNPVVGRFVVSRGSLP